jgi:hypothetical protein
MQHSARQTGNRVQEIAQAPPEGNHKCRASDRTTAPKTMDSETGVRSPGHIAPLGGRFTRRVLAPPGQARTRLTILPEREPHRSAERRQKWNRCHKHNWPNRGIYPLEQEQEEPRKPNTGCNRTSNPETPAGQQAGENEQAKRNHNQGLNAWGTTQLRRPEHMSDKLQPAMRTGPANYIGGHGANQRESEFFRSRVHLDNPGTLQGPRSVRPSFGPVMAGRSRTRQGRSQNPTRTRNADRNT